MDPKVGTSDSRSFHDDQKDQACGWLERLPPSTIQIIHHNRNKSSETESAKPSLFFPPEITHEIFLKLPISSVVRCSLLCKSFEKVSKAPDFALTHAKDGTDRSPFLIFHHKRNRYGAIPYYLSCLNIGSMNGCVGTVQKIYIPFQDIMLDYLVAGSCLGYLLLVSLEFRPPTKWALLLYNPLTRDFKELPVPSQVPSSLFAYGYGYHFGTGEFKVLMASFFTEQIGSNRGNGQLEVQILTVGMGNWRSLEIPSCWVKEGVVVSQFVPDKQALWVNGSLYWLTSTESMITEPSEVARQINIFDLATEKFDEIAAPNGASHLVDIRGNLSAVVNNEKGSWEIWVMKDNDMQQESWTREFVLGHYMPAVLRHSENDEIDHLKYVRVVCRLNNGKLLLKYGCKAWCYYDPETELYEDLTIRGLPGEFETVVHVGSLSYMQTLV